MTKPTTETFTAFSLGTNILKHFPLDAVEYFSMHSEMLFFSWNVYDVMRIFMQCSGIYQLPKAAALTSDETPLSSRWLARRCLSPHGMQCSCLEHTTGGEQKQAIN